MDWKNHPLVIACVSCASTCVFCISVIVPIYEKKNINTISDLEARLDTLTSSNNQKTKTIENFQASEVSLSKEITKKNQEILKLREEDRFSDENPFPKGFRDIAILQDFEKIKEIYKESAKPAKSGWIHVDIQDKLFSSVTYYRLECEKKNRVSHVLFQLNDLYTIALKDKSKPIPNFEENEEFRKRTAQMLVNIFREKYGPEYATPEDDEYYFKIKNVWIAGISPKGLVIQSILTSEKLNQACIQLNSRAANKT